MKIGVFDSGLGGLIILKALTKKLPQYDYVYLGDTKRVPYGDRSHEVIYEFTKQGVDFLFAKGCSLVILACNTASAQALRQIQQSYLPKKHPGKKVLGVIIPTAEEAALNKKLKKLLIIATTATTSSKSYERELRKERYRGKIISKATPLLVPLIEENLKELFKDVLSDYLKPLQKQGIDGIILGCTHYPILRKQVQGLLGSRVAIYSQDSIIPQKLKSYLKRHADVERALSKKHARQLYATDLTGRSQALAERWFGKKAKLKLVDLPT